jgi:hypothetical protein
MTYDEEFNGNLANMQALRELFPPVGDLGARKRHRQAYSQHRKFVSISVQCNNLAYSTLERVCASI